MAFQIADRVKETTTTTGTGTLDLGGAVSQFQTFVAGIGNGNETYYSIEDPTGTDWEVGIGTVTDAATDTLSRDTVISSSNGGSLVNFSAGQKFVFSTQPASKTFILSSDNTAVISNINASTLTAGTVNDARLSANVTLNNASTISTGTLADARLTANVTLNNASTISAGTLADARLTANVTLNNASTISAGTLADARLSANVTLNNASTISTGTLPNARLSAIPNSALENAAITINGTSTDLGGSINVGDITGVTAGSGLTGGGASGAVTLNVGAGTGIDVAADAISVDVSDFMTNGSNNRVLTATGTDAINAEANMTFDGSTLAVTGGATFTANVSLSDNDYLRLGTSQDLLIYHDGSNSIIKDNGTGNLRLQSTNSIQIGDESMNETFAIFNDDSDVKLYHNNSEKFATTSTGISVTGTVVESSSIEYKENIQPLQFNEAIYNVNAVKYDRKDGSAKDEVGVIAEELYKVLPDLVTTKDGKPEAVKYTKMTMYLLEALKKQNQEIQLLKEKLNG